MKKLLSVFLTVIMLLAVIPANAWKAIPENGKNVGYDCSDLVEYDEALPSRYGVEPKTEDFAPPVREVHSGTCGPNLTWTLDTGTGVLTISGSGAMSDWSTGENETAPWYSWRSLILRVVILHGASNIGDHAFYKCTSLANVTIPDSVSCIGDSAFHDCSSLTSITIPNSVTIIEDWAFYGCSSLMSINVPNSVISVGTFAFVGCYSLKSVVLGNSVANIGYGVFVRCTSLEKITVDQSNRHYCSVGNVLFNKNKTFLICSAKNLNGEYVIPNSVARVEKAAFYGCSSLESIIIPYSVTDLAYEPSDAYISHGTFQNCSSLTSIVIPDSVTNIGEDTFYACSSLITVTLSKRIDCIDYDTFGYCRSLTNVNIPSNVKKIKGGAFYYCSSLTSVTIPASVKTIEGSAFRYCSSLTDVTFIGKPPTSFETDAFQGCSSDFCIYYPLAYKSYWAPKGENSWYNYPIAPIGPENSCTVVFRCNDGTSNIYHSSVVTLGSYVFKPNDPTRAGYALKGWYSNPECSGQPWFNKSNNYKGKPINSNLSLYAKWEPEQAFDYGTDFYSFLNKYETFVDPNEPGAYSSKGHYTMSMERMIPADYLRYLFSWDINFLQSGAAFGGACFGMSYTAALFNSGKADINNYQEAGYHADCVHDFRAPVTNKKLRGLIILYHLLQCSRNFTSEHPAYSKEADACRALVEALQNGDDPVIVNFKVKFSFKHSVLAYDLRESGDNYIVSIADPSMSAPISLTIKKSNFKNMGFSVPEYEHLIRHSVITNAIPFSSVSDFFTIDSKAYAFRGSESSSYALITTNLYSFRIESTTGEYAVIEDGEKAEGDLVISDGDCVNEINSELRLEYSLPLLAEGDSYAIIPGDNLNMLTDEPLEEYFIGIESCDGSDIRYFEVNASNEVSVSFNTGSDFSTNCDISTEQVLCAYSSDMNAPWDRLEIVGDTTGVSINLDNSCVSVFSDNETVMDITASSKTNNIVFEGISVDENGIAVSYNDNDLVEVSNAESGETMAESEFFYSVLFCTMGADPIDTQTGIPYGGLASAPAAPAREGLIFGGWYTTYECEDGTEWSFDTPITEDTFIFAKWIIDDDYSHSVTFRVEGQDDVIYLVNDGEALTDYTLPDIPAREGLVGFWPYFDLSCITEDIIIEVIYATSLPGDANGDGTVDTVDALLILRCALYISGDPDEIMNCDMDGNGIIDTVDALLVLRLALSTS